MRLRPGLFKRRCANLVARLTIVDVCMVAVLACLRRSLQNVGGFMCGMAVGAANLRVPFVLRQCMGFIVVWLLSTRAMLSRVLSARSAVSWQPVQASFSTAVRMSSAVGLAFRMPVWTVVSSGASSWQFTQFDGASEKSVQAEAAAVFASREWHGAHSSSGFQVKSSCRETCSTATIPGINALSADVD